MAGLIVRPRARIFHGHDWVYSNEVLKVFGQPQDGDVISLKDGRDRFLGSATYNSRSTLTARRFSFRKQALDEDFFRRRIQRAVEYRNQIGYPGPVRRLVWSESDGLPGLVVDQFQSVAVIQTVTAGMDQHCDTIARALLEIEGISTVLERNDTSSRRAEGLEMRNGLLAGESNSQVEIEIAGIFFQLDLLDGQKTGFYLDQVAAYSEVAAHSHGRRVLDCFSNQGGFALACAKNGATEVTAVEASETALEQLRENARRNDVSVHCQEADVFEFFRKAENRHAEYDLIILDPPSFAKSKAGTSGARRGYRDLHARAARLLTPHGILATFSCSHHVGWGEFESVIAEGLSDARRSARILKRLQQPADHPILVHLPESEYIKGLLLEALPAR